MEDRAVKCCLCHASYTRAWSEIEHPSKEILSFAAESGLDLATLCNDCLRGDVHSPCQKDCGFEIVAGKCSGCRRSRSDVDNWDRMSEKERARVLLRLYSDWVRG